MRKGLILTGRDLKILEHLWYGPATDLNIFEAFFQKEDGNIKTRRRVMKKRLQKLESDGIIKSTVNPRIKRTIYVLDKKGGECVADASGREVSNVWSHFPKNDIFHDLIVSGVAKMVVKEVETIEGYSIDFLVFERSLKSLQKSRKGFCYPDFQMGIKTPNGQYVYDIEIDCGNISRADLIAKMNSFNNVILLVTHKDARMDLLYRYLMESHCNKAVYVCSFERIVKRGFFKGQWFSIINGKWEPLDPRLEGR
jgi:DNA-binding PadR family transcriptional regulator